MGAIKEGREVNVSRGSRIPALPPKSGCLVCAGPHSAVDCSHTAALGLSRFEAGKVHEKQVYRDHLARLAALRDAPAREQTLAERIAFAEAMSADMDADNERARRRVLGVGR